MSDELDKLGAEFAVDQQAKRIGEEEAAKSLAKVGSRQLQTFKKAIIKDGLTVEAAAEKAKIGLPEAQLHARDDEELKAALAARETPKAEEETPAADPAPVAADVVNDPVPPAPGEDAESVFERRMDRLTNIVEEAEFESGTALGDLVDCVLELFKHRPKLWSAMLASERQDTIRHIQAMGKQVLRKVVYVVAQDESDTIEGTLLGQFSVKGETIEAKIKIDHSDEDVLLSCYRLAGHKVVIVSADEKRFASTRREPEVEPDQAEIPFADDAPTPAPSPAPAPAPADDSDLAGGEAETSIVDKVVEASEPKFGEAGYKGDAPSTKPVDPPAEDAAKFGVFDTARGEWLTAEDGDENDWSAEASEAFQWPYEQAKEIADAYEAPGEVVAKALP